MRKKSLVWPVSLHKVTFGHRGLSLRMVWRQPPGRSAGSAGLRPQDCWTMPGAGKSKKNSPPEPPREPALLAPWFPTSGVPDCEILHFWDVQPPVCAAALWQPWDIDTCAAPSTSPGWLHPVPGMDRMGAILFCFAGKQRIRDVSIVLLLAPVQLLNTERFFCSCPDPLGDGSVTWLCAGLL